MDCRVSLLMVLTTAAALVQGRRKFVPHDIEKLPISIACQKFDVSETIYRTANGHCNNIFHENWGKSEIPLYRYIPNAYDDGINRARINGVNRNPLPSPRKVSSAVHTYNPAIFGNYNTAMFMQWGQFLDHDLTATPLGEDVDGSCCTADVLAGSQHPDVAMGGTCFPIVVPADDLYFNTTCLDFKRSLSAGTSIREQKNVLTAFVDGSQIYGSSKEEQSKLRTFVNGQMKVSSGNNLPVNDDQSACVKILDTDHCFQAGDHRVNVFVGLSALHTAFLRFHNKLARKFDLATGWTDEQIFQESRKIVAAVLQHITYTEYLPQVLGVNGWLKYHLHDIDYHYFDTIDPSIYNAFATAAFRYGHSTIVKSLIISGVEIPTEQLFLRPYYVLHHLKSLIHSLSSHPSELSDRYFVEAITNKLFLNDSISSDLIALNINRGRDHGIPSYNEFRQKACGLPKIPSFNSPAFGDYGSVLSSIYDHVDDIDLFTGGIAESSVHGGAVGETFNCIIGTQFHLLKFGDSFWYETKDRRRGFSPVQIAEIKKIFLSRVLCDTILEKQPTQPFVFVSRTLQGNAEVNCNLIPNFNFNVFLNTVPGNQQPDAKQGSGRDERKFRLNNGPAPPPADQPPPPPPRRLITNN